DLMKKFPEIPQSIEEDYHSIKDDIPLEIRVTDDFKAYLMVFMTVDVLMNQPQPVEEKVEKLVEGDEDEESYASKFDDSVLNDDVDDSGTRLKEKKDEEIKKEKNNDNVKETDKVVKEKYIVDDVMGSTEIRKEQKQTPIPLPTRSPRNVSSSDK
ncbi:hypothetical protein Tco_0120336, partial [Tanacetum coccineum]